MEKGSGRGATGGKIFNGRTKNGKGNLLSRLNGSGRHCNSNIHRGRIHLTVGKQGYRTMMPVGVRVLMD